MGALHAKPVKPSLVIAIDFGTSYSGYAFAYRHKKHDILLNDNWGKEVGAEFYKTPTSVLYDEKGNFNSFGFLSEKNYFEMLNENKKPSYFRCFKMELYGKQKLDSKLQIVGEGGCKTAGLDVFAHARGFMKEKVLEKIKNHNGSLPNPIRWVVTVPAIWNEEQKKFMREACLKAGLMRELYSQDLVIALEPESASLYCRELAWDQFTELDGNNAPSLRKGTVYMVVDLGGGTVDITVHKLTKEQMVEEVIPPSGGNHGGYNVNQEFKSLLNRILGKNFMDHLNKTRPEILPRMLLDFEKAKRTFDEANPSVHIPLHYGLAECYEKYTGKIIRDLLNGGDINMSESGNIIIKGETMKDFFCKVVDNIYTAVNDAVNACPESSKPSYIYLVGGFSESKYVQKRIKTLETICKNPKPQIMIPHEASLCVLKGAVKYGQSSKSIKTRISKLSYATLLMRDFKEGEDDKSRKEKVGDRYKIKYLKPILQKGEPVEEGLIRSHQILMGYKGEDIDIIVYSSEEKITENPKAVNLNEFGHIVVEGNGKKTTTNREATLHFILGKTELELRVSDSDKKEILASMKYAVSRKNFAPMYH